MFCQPILYVVSFSGGVLCECIVCFNELEAVTTHGFDRVYMSVLYSKYGLRCAATEVQGKRWYLLSDGLDICSFFGNEITISGVTFCFSLKPF